MLRRSMLASVDDAPPELHAAVAAADLDAVIRGDASLRSALTDAIGATRLSDDARADALQRIDRLGAGEDDHAAADVPLRENRLLAPQIARAEVAALATAIDVPRRAAERIAENVPSLSAITAERLAALREEHGLSARAVERLSFAASVGNLVDRDMALTAAVHGRVVDLVELAALDAGAWEKTLDEAGVDPPDGIGRRAYAERIAERVATLLPTDATLGRLLPGGSGTLAARVRRLDAQARRDLAAALPALGLDDPSLSVKARDRLLVERAGLLERVRERNPHAELLSLDYTTGSSELARLDLDGIDEDARPAVLACLAGLQRMQTLAGAQAPTLLKSGLHSAGAVVRAGIEGLVQAGLAADAAADVHARARDRVEATLAGLGTLIDVGRSGLSTLAVDNAAPDLTDFLRTFDGYSALFGDQGYCTCEHCKSILSPAAYFVDLMCFVDEHLTGPTFGGRQDHPLNLRTRRPDLWTLPLTCASTNDPIPTLDVINPILERAIAGRLDPAIDLGDRANVERVVYTELAQSSGSFRQPFALAQTQLDVLLARAELSRAQVARALGADARTVATADLRLSPRERTILTTPQAAKAKLERLYGMTLTVTSDEIAPLDAQALLAPVGVDRGQLGQLLATRFVTGSAAAASPVRIVAQKRDADSVQNDVERVLGLTPKVLDRLHRFTRLWRACEPWTIGELDLVLGQLGATELSETTLEDVVDVRALQARLGTDAEESTALFADLPTVAVDASAPLVARLFNGGPPGAEQPALPDPGMRFVHPALRSSATGDGQALLHRLTAALGLGDSDLLVLVRALAGALGFDPEAANEDDRGFPLTLGNLSLLYRHARLAACLRRPLADLFAALVLVGAPAGAAGSRVELHALLELDAWLGRSGLALADLTFVTGAAAPASPSGADPSTIASRLVAELQADRGLVLADTAFAAIAGVTADQSRAVVAANPAALEALPGGSGWRLRRSFARTTALTVPAGVAAGDDQLREVLLRSHASVVVPARLAAQLHEQPERVAALLPLAGADPWAPELWDELWAGAPPVLLATAAGALGRLTTLYSDGAFDADAIAFVAAHPAIFELPDPLHPTLAAARAAAAFGALLSDLAAGRQADLPQLDPADLRTALEAVEKSGLAATDADLLGRVIGAPAAVAAGIRDNVDVAGGPLDVLRAYAAAAALARTLGVGGTTLAQIASEDADEQAAAVQAMLGALHVSYPDDASWADHVGTAEDRIRDRRRDALCDYLTTAIHPELADRSALYRLYLVDVELAGCARTTLVSAAISSVQLYVHRCRMNLEQDGRPSSDPAHVHVRPRLVPADEWAWRKSYRVWEANRKVFLWPENYLEPELRDDKTPLFEELESTLLQQRIDEQNVLDAYTTYLHGFEELANLRIAGAYHQTGAHHQTGILNGSADDVLHLFGVTNADPPTFYYRTVENLYASRAQDARGVVWSPWRKIGVQIPVRDVGPVVYRGRLHLFWVEYKTRSFNDVSGGASRFAGYRHTMMVKFTALRLDGTWTPPQDVDLKLNAYPFPTEAGLYVDDKFFDPGAFVAAVSSSVAGISPRFDTVLHTQAHEDYHPRFPGWTRIVPQVRNDGELVICARNFQLNAVVDLRRRVLTSSWGPYPYEPPSWLPLLSQLDTRSSRRLFSGYPALFRCNDNAMAELALQRSRIVEFERDWPQNAHLEAGLYGEALADLPEQADLRSVINQITDAIIQSGGDALLVRASVTGSSYSIARIGTTLAEGLSERLFTAGVDGLLDLRYQLSLEEAGLPLWNLTSRIEDDSNAGTLDYRGAYGTYYRELFFHVPFLIADHLNSQGNYAAAQRWYHYIFDPTADDDVRARRQAAHSPQQVAELARDRVWRYRELRGLGVPKLRAALTDPVALEAYRKDPFNPHAIARLRLTAYQQSIVMKYVDNLLDWADDLYTQFTTESITEATMLYVMVADILGPRPATLGDCGEDESVRTFEAIQPLVTEGHEILVELEAWSIARRAGRTIDKLTLERPVEPAAVAGADRLGQTATAPAAQETSRGEEAIFDGSSWRRTAISSWTGADGLAGRDRAIGHAGGGHAGADARWRFGWGVLRQVTPVFCVPANKDLRAYWTRLEDRLFKLHHCMDITGTVRQLAPFAPDIDPMLLVRAKAAGLSVEDALAFASAEAPPYRFTFLLEKAKANAATVQAFGAALLGAIERRDAEQLTQVRNSQQRDLLNLTTHMRQSDLQAAEHGKQRVERQVQVANERLAYYQGLIDTGRTPWEVTQSASRHAASGLTGGAATLRSLAGVMFLIPQLGSPFAMKYGGSELGNSVDTWSSVARDLAGVAEAIAASAGLEAGFDRRDQGWRFQRDTVRGEIPQLELEVKVAELRRVMAERALAIHNATIDQNDEIAAFYANKFSSFGLYTWLSASLQRIHRDAYNGALAIALDAERAYQYECDDPGAPTLVGGTWEAGNAGLLAGERLLSGLQALERRYLETNHRTLEIDQPFALSQIDPAALLQLRATGSCEFAIPEAALDLAYPGHYRRRIKGVRVTIPCITGPYTNIAATLTLTGSSVRSRPVLGADELKEMPLQRVHSVATSTAQGDAGVFELSFRDERYLPFEGAGAISDWKLELPAHFRQFDYGTINDVILNISYGALADGALREQVEDVNAAIEGSLKKWLQDTTLTRIFSLRQDFSAAFVRLLKSTAGTQSPAIEIGERYFPIFLRGLDLSVTKWRLAATTPVGVTPAGLKLTANGVDVPALSPDASLGGLYAADVSSAFGASLPAALELGIAAAGTLAPPVSPGVPPTTTIDDRKLLDLLLIVDYSAT